MAKKPHIGELVDGLVAETRALQEGMEDLVNDYKDLSERTEVSNGLIILELAEKTAGYLEALVNVVVVIQEGRAGK